MSENLNLGQLINGKQEKDAVHIAVVPVVAGEDLSPGQHVGILSNDEEIIVGPINNKNSGIIDPFLKQKILKNQKCWMFMYPGSITSLRHDWQHPALCKTEIEKSELWLKEFAKELGYDYNWVCEIALSSLCKGYSTVGDDDAQDIFNEKKEEFLRHAAIAFGKKPLTEEEVDNVYFSCAC